MLSLDDFVGKVNIWFNIPKSCIPTDSVTKPLHQKP